MFSNHTLNLIFGKLVLILLNSWLVFELKEIFFHPFCFLNLFFYTIDQKAKLLLDLR